METEAVILSNTSFCVESEKKIKVSNSFKNITVLADQMFSENNMSKNSILAHLKE